ncbi:MAG: aminodeoxychorismate synthase component I [Planctomycetota bacterium]
MTTALQSCATVVVEPLDVGVSVEAACRVFAEQADAAILESSLPDHPNSRFSILACDAVEEFVVSEKRPECPFRLLADRNSRYPAITGKSAELPFFGGWIGYFAYESGLNPREVQTSTLSDLPLPLAHWRFYDAAAVYDHRLKQWVAVAVDWPADSEVGRLPVRERVRSVRRRLEKALEFAEETSETSVEPAWTTDPQPNMTKASYLQKVRQAKQYIESGDIYQVNLTQRFTSRTSLSSLQVYDQLRRYTPSPFAAFLRAGPCTILSASPELFLELRDGHVLARPIKGTRPRGKSPSEDRNRISELQTSAKDSAELAMIVDLLRNDLGRVCEFGSVRVVDAAQIETHPTVHHQVATIEGRLVPQRDWADLLRAAFPCGSITGAPKIRAMQIIDELEPTARGVYCGTIGHIGLDGSMCLNVAIRTLVHARDAVHFYAGGAIVADSNAEEEYEEILTKTAGIRRALGCDEPSPYLLLPGQG